jgi:hypothetical protein
MDGSKKDNFVECCFCDLKLPKKEAVLLRVFPEIDNDESQDVFTHKKCLRERIKTTIPLHPDL